MNYLIAAQTDIGNIKKSNQDSYCIKVATSKNFGNILFSVVCDGMGGLSKGELASATVVKEFEKWFEDYYPLFLQNNTVNIETIKKEWSRLARVLNNRIGTYGANLGISLGTTLVGCVTFGDRLFVINVGDSRLYKITTEVKRLTQDQSLVASEIASGKLPPEAEETDKRRNVLLQCIGASHALEPVIEEHPLEAGAVYLLCTDGFRHEITESEMLGLLSPTVVDSEGALGSTLKDIINLLKQRQEKDNITAVAFKTVQD